MGTTPHEEPERTRGTTAQVGVGVISLVEDWLRDTAYVGIGLFSLAVAFSGFAVPDGLGNGLLGIAVGLGAVVLASVPMAKQVGAGRIWLALLAAALLDASAIAFFVAQG